MLKYPFPQGIKYLKNKKLIFITKVNPSLNGTGVQLRCARHIVSLSKIFDIIVVKSPPDNQEDVNLTSCYFKVEYFDFSSKQQSVFPLLSLNHAYAKPDDNLLKALHRIFKTHQPDFVFCFRLTTAQIIFSNELTQLVPQSFWILDLDDIESRALGRYAKVRYKELGKITTLKVFINALKIRLLERSVFNQFGRVLVCSDADQIHLTSKFKKAEFCVVPNVINDVVELLPTNEKFTVLFVGTMSYMPNEQAVIYFCEAILPLVLNKLDPKQFKVNIVGFNPSDKVKSLANDMINVTGGVEAVTPYYQKANVVIAPILSGGGTRIKILEAMAFGRAVVSTAIGAEGLLFEPDKDILIADQDLHFANCIANLLTDDKLRIKIETNGKQAVKEKYTQEALNTIYKNLMV
jgi:glycosyltransferase involved in cell wall biosynthesis